MDIDLRIMQAIVTDASALGQKTIFIHGNSYGNNIAFWAKGDNRDVTYTIVENKVTRSITNKETLLEIK